MTSKNVPSAAHTHRRGARVAIIPKLAQCETVLPVMGAGPMASLTWILGTAYPPPLVA